MSVRGWASEGCPKLLSLKEDTPLLALPDSVELLPSRPDWGLVGEAGIGWRGDCKRKGGHVRIPLSRQANSHSVEKTKSACNELQQDLQQQPVPSGPRAPGSPRITCISVAKTQLCPGCWAFVPPKPGAGLLAVALGHLRRARPGRLGRQKET